MAARWLFVEFLFVELSATFVRGQGSFPMDEVTGKEGSSELRCQNSETQVEHAN